MQFQEYLKEAARGSQAVSGSGEAVREDGFRRGRVQTPAYIAKLSEAAAFMLSVFEGRRSMAALQEALSTSDFPLLMGDTLERMLMERYKQMGAAWLGVFKRVTVRDFRATKTMDVLGGMAALEEVKQYEAYPMDVFDETSYSLSVLKYGKMFKLPWEIFVNDDLDAFRDLPQRMYDAAVNTESRKAVGHYAANATIYSNGNANILNTTNGAGTNNPSFGVNAVKDFMTVLSRQRDTDGNPIVLDDMQVTVEYPPALEVAVKNFFNAIEVNVTQGPGSTTVGAGTNAGYELRVANWMKSNMIPKMNPWLPVIDTVSGDTRFYFHMGQGTTRAPFRIGFLRGYEQPQVFTKSSGHNGSEVDGDFDHDVRAWKVRHIIGTGTGDTKLTYTSDGTNS